MSVSFDRVAPYYDLLARGVFGQSIRRAQLHFLDQIPPNARVLVVGGGTGWLLVELLRKPEVAHVTYREASARMLAIAQRKVRKYSQSEKESLPRVRFVHGTERQLASEGRFPEERFSVIITNFVLDMYEGEALDDLIQTLAARLEPNGRWLFTDFRLSSQKRHRGWQRWMAQAMYGFFHLTAGITRQSLPPYHQHFARHNFRMTHERSFYGDFIVSRVYRKDSGT